MTLLIIPILIEIAAGALERGAATAIAEWAGGNILKKFVATKVAEKAVEEGRKMVTSQYDNWRGSFKTDPGEAFNNAAVSLLNAQNGNLLQENTDVNPEIVADYRQRLVAEVGQEVIRRATRRATGQSDTILDFDRDAVADRAVEGVISRGLALANGQTAQTSTVGSGSALSGNFEGVTRRRSLSLYADDPANAENIIRSAARSAYDDTFDEQEFTRTILGDSDSIQAIVERPIEDMTEKVFDINEEVSR